MKVPVQKSIGVTWNLVGAVRIWRKKNKSFYYFVENIKVKILGIWEKSGKIPDFLW